MSGSEDKTQVTFTELRKFPIMDGGSTNFESITFEQLKAQLSDKPIKLQRYTVHGDGNALSRIELFFTNGF